MEFICSEAGKEEIELHELSASHFSELLQYLYTGQITIHEDNVFELIEIAEYLQLEDDLLESCVKLLLKRLKYCDLPVLFRVWNVCEQYNYQDLKNRVMRVLERRLNEFISRDFFMFLGFQEVMEVVTLPSLCVENEKVLFDTLINWARRKKPDETDTEEMIQFSQFIMQMLSKLRVTFMPPDYVRKSVCSLFNDTSIMDPLSIPHDPKSDLNLPLRTCNDCVYVFEFSKSDTEILGIKEFVAQRRERPTYAFLDPRNANCFILNAFTHSKSYFQHFGPHSVTDFQMLCTVKELMTLGGLKRSTGNITNELKIFDLERATWEQYGGSLPINLVQFGSVFHDEEIYIFGGWTDEFCTSGEKVSFMNKTLSVSQHVYKIPRSGLTSMAVHWKNLPSIPKPRHKFASVKLQEKVYLIGNGFCDCFDLKLETWTEFKHAPADLGTKPVTCTMGSRIYTFGDRPETETNVFMYLETVTGTWHPMPNLPFRHDVIDIFAHNSLIYLLSWNRLKQTMMHEFCPLEGIWRCVITELKGTLRKGTMLRKYVITDSGFFDKLQPITLVRNADAARA